MPQSFSLGPIKLHFYGIFIGLGFWVLYLYSLKNSYKFGLSQKNVDICFVLSSFFALFGARFYHVLHYWFYYRANLVKIFSIINGGFGIFGLIIGIIVGLFISSRIQKVSFHHVLDLIFPPLLLSQGIGRIGNFFNLEAYGPPTNIPWSVTINGESVHPTFFYETILCLIAFVVYLYESKHLKHFGFIYYLMSYGAIRFFTEFLRKDTWIVAGIRLGFILSLLMFFVGLFLLINLKFTKKR